jgi:hypothetical protein
MQTKKPVVWIFNQFAGTPDSGWGERHYFFAQHWIKEGWEVVIFSGSFNHVFKKNVKVKSGFYEEENYQGVRFVWVKNPKYNPQSVMRFVSMLIFTFRLFFMGFKKFGKPKSIVVSSMPIFPILPALYFKWMFKIPVIFEIRDIWPLTLIHLGNVKSWHPLVLFIGWFEKLAYRKSDKVVSLLPNAQKHVEAVAKKSVDFHYIPNGIDENLVGFEDIPKDLEELIPKDRFIVGYAGTIGLANALEHFVDAALSFTYDEGISFLIVGDGYLKEELMLKCANSGHVLLYPKIKKAQIQNLLTYFDVAFVGRAGTALFSHGVSANKYFDYMLAGLPILDSNNLIKDPVELSGCGLLVEPDSTYAIVEGIKRLSTISKEDRKNLGESGRKYVLSKHSIAQLSLIYSRNFGS